MNLALPFSFVHQCPDLINFPGMSQSPSVFYGLLGKWHIKMRVASFHNCVTNIVLIPLKIAALGVMWMWDDFHYHLRNTSIKPF